MRRGLAFGGQRDGGARGPRVAGRVERGQARVVGHGVRVHVGRAPRWWVHRRRNRPTPRPQGGSVVGTWLFSASIVELVCPGHLGGGDVVSRCVGLLDPDRGVLMIAGWLGWAQQVWAGSRKQVTGRKTEAVKVFKRTTCDRILTRRADPRYFCPNGWTTLALGHLCRLDAADVLGPNLDGNRPRRPRATPCRCLLCGGRGGHVDQQ